MAVTSLITSQRAIAPFDETVLARIRAVLVAERATQMDLVRSNGEIADALMGQRDVDSILEREIAEAAAARAAEAIDDIDRALAEMAEGTYGTCEVCRDPIPVARLEAIPHARRCVTCSV